MEPARGAPVILYGHSAGRQAGEIARAVRDGLARTARGERVTVHRGGEPLDHKGLRQWFCDKLDGMINLKAGLRSDGAPRKTRCACKHCLGRCDCALRKIFARGGLVCGYGCRAPWGGRRWENDWQASAWRDSRRARDRVLARARIRQFETEVARARLAHLIDRD